MWKIQKIISKGDYNYALVPEHPNSTKNGYVLHHRIVVENYLGRLLNSREVVHHINHDKKDNHIDNLEVMPVKDHAILHATKGRCMVDCKCPECGIIFQREKRNSHLCKGGRSTFCSRKCNGTFSRKNNFMD